MESDQIQAAIKELQDAMVVMAHMETRQTDRLLRQEKEIEDLALSRARTDQTMRRLRKESRDHLQAERFDRLRRGSLISLGERSPGQIVTAHKPDVNRIETRLLPQAQFRLDLGSRIGGSSSAGSSCSP